MKDNDDSYGIENSNNDVDYDSDNKYNNMEDCTCDDDSNDKSINDNDNEYNNSD